MDWGTWGQWAGVLVAVFLAIAAVIQRLHARVEAMDVRLTKAETELLHLPSRSEFHNIDTKLSSLSVHMEQASKSFQAMVALHERAQDRLAEREAMTQLLAARFGGAKEETVS